MVFQAGRWRALTMKERWLLLNGLAAIQKQKNERRRHPIVVTSLTVQSGDFN